MDDRNYKVIVERMNRLQTILLLWGITFVAYAISWLFETKLGIVVRGEIILLVIIIGLCFLTVKLERFFPSVAELEVEFKQEEVVFRRGRKKRTIFYRNIREVEKIMIITQYHSEKGYYRVRIKTEGRPYTLYSGEDSNKELDFEETGLSKIYFEFQNRGVKCC